MALPGMLTLLSLLAVVLGQQPRPVDVQPRVMPSATVPVVPEIRPLPAPASPAPLTGAPPTEPFQIRVEPLSRLRAPLVWTFQPARPDLTWWGRRQTDGG